MNKISFEKYIELQIMMMANYQYCVHGPSEHTFFEKLTPSWAKEKVDEILTLNKCDVYKKEDIPISPY